jgi:hypothetical protein
MLVCIVVAVLWGPSSNAVSAFWFEEVSPRRAEKPRRGVQMPQALGAGEGSNASLMTALGAENAALRWPLLVRRALGNRSEAPRR